MGQLFSKRKKNPAKGLSSGAIGSANIGSGSIGGNEAAAAQPALNIADYTFSKRRGELLLRAPGAIAGQRFIVEECDDCDIWLCDAMSTITFDECKNCRVFIGPVEGSCFVRTCRGCKFIAAVQQWRMRDCEDCDVLLHTTTEPVVESSHTIRFGCFRFAYQALREQFAKSQLDPFTNKWSDVYDFTPTSDSFSLMPLEAEEKGGFLKALPEQIPLGDGAPVVPITSGKRIPAGGERAVVLIAGDGAADRSMAFAREAAPRGFAVVRSRGVQKVDRDACAKLIGDAARAKELYGSVASSDFIAFEIAGAGCAEKARALGQAGAGFACLSSEDGAAGFAAKLFETEMHM